MRVWGSGVSMGIILQNVSHAEIVVECTQKECEDDQNKIIKNLLSIPSLSKPCKFSSNSLICSNSNSSV